MKVIRHCISVLNTSKQKKTNLSWKLNFKRWILFLSINTEVTGMSVYQRIE